MYLETINPIKKGRDTMLQRSSQRRHVGRYLAAAALALLLACLLYGRDAAQQLRAESGADIAITLTAAPNVGVTAGSIINYHLHVKNFGDADADRVFIHMPYNPQHLRVLDANFEQPEDWVTAVAFDYLTLTFGELAADDDRTAVVRMYVAETLPQGTVIDMWAGFGWDDADGGAQGKSANAAPVVVEPAAINSGALWMAVEPTTGPAGTVYGFFTNRFAPGERLRTWLIAPYGTQRIDLDTTVDEEGRAWFELASAGLPPGDYQLFVRGERTDLVAAAPFRITLP